MLPERLQAEKDRELSKYEYVEKYREEVRQGKDGWERRAKRWREGGMGMEEGEEGIEMTGLID